MAWDTYGLGPGAFEGLSARGPFVLQSPLGPLPLPCPAGPWPLFGVFLRIKLDLQFFSATQKWIQNVEP